MSDRSVFSLIGYLLLCLTVLTPLYDPLTTGVDQSWAIAVVPAAASVALGAFLKRAWVLLAPLGVCLIWAAAAGLEGVFVLVFGLPVALGLTAIGWGVGRLAGRRSDLIAAAALAVALAPLAWATADTMERASAPHEPEAIQKQLPRGGIDLSGLCRPGSWKQAAKRHALHKLDVLVHELKVHPDWLVSYTYYLEDPSGVEVKDLTVEEVAQETLGDLDDSCTAPRERIENALG